MAKRPSTNAGGGIAGFLKTSRVARVVVGLKKRMGRGEIRFNEFRARGPQTRDRVIHPLLCI
jgi:hypothetical protein